MEQKQKNLNLKLSWKSMTIEIIIACCAALYAAANLLWRKEVRNATQIALQRKITASSSFSKLKDFLHAGSNRRVTGRYFYELPMIKVFYFISVFFSTLVFLASVIITGMLGIGEQGYQVPPLISRVMYFSVVLSIASSYGCTILAGRE